jgi:hypothetical protein
MSYYLEPKAAPHSHKPYDRKRARRDIHVAGIASHRLSASVRRARREAVPPASETGA